MTQLSGWLLRHKLVVLGGWLVALLVGVVLAPTVSQRLSTDFSLPARVASYASSGDRRLVSADGRSAGAEVVNLTLIGGLGALAVLLLVFGSVLALAPLLVAAVAILATLLLVGLLTVLTEVNLIVEYLVALIGLGVAIDYSLLLVTRWREERTAGHAGDQAVHRAMASAGRSVVLSASTVAVGLLSLVVLPVPYLRSVGVAGLLIRCSARWSPSRCCRWRWPARAAGSTGRGGGSGRMWEQAVPGPRGRVPSCVAAGGATVAAVAALAILGGFALRLQVGDEQASSLASAGPAHQALVALRAAGVPAGVLTPIEVLVPASAATDPAALASGLAQMPGVWAAVAPNEPAWRRGRHRPGRGGGSGRARGQQTVQRVRATMQRLAPGARVGGVGAENLDFARAVYGRFPLIVAVIAAITFVLLARAFRSLLLAAKAVAVDLLSIGAIVLVWQLGHGARALGGVAGTGDAGQLRAAVRVRVPVRALDGLRGVPAGPHARGLRRHRLDRRRRRPRGGPNGPAGDQRRAHPVPGVRVAGRRPRHRHQDLRHRAGRGHPAGCDRGALPAGPRAGLAAGPLELVAARLGRHHAGCGPLPRRGGAHHPPAAHDTGPHQHRRVTQPCRPCSPSSPHRPPMGSTWGRWSCTCTGCCTRSASCWPSRWPGAAEPSAATTRPTWTGRSCARSPPATSAPAPPTSRPTAASSSADGCTWSPSGRAAWPCTAASPLGSCSAPGSPTAAACRCWRRWTPPSPGSRWRRRWAAGATTSTRSCSAPPALSRGRCGSTPVTGRSGTWGSPPSIPLSCTSRCTTCWWWVRCCGWSGVIACAPARSCWPIWGCTRSDGSSWSCCAPIPPIGCSGVPQRLGVGRRDARRRRLAVAARAPPAPIRRRHRQRGREHRQGDRWPDPPPRRGRSSIRSRLTGAARTDGIRHGLLRGRRRRRGW